MSIFLNFAKNSLDRDLYIFVQVDSWTYLHEDLSTLITLFPVDIDHDKSI